MPNTVRELGHFLQFYSTPDMCVEIELDTANMDRVLPVRQKTSTVTSDSSSKIHCVPTQFVNIFQRGSCILAATTTVSNRRLVREDIRYAVMSIDSEFPRSVKCYRNISVYLIRILGEVFDVPLLALYHFIYVLHATVLIHS